MILFLVVLVVSLISDFFLLNLSNFLDFIMIDVENLSVEGLLIECLLSISSIVRVLKADKGIYSLSVFAEDLDTFNVTVFTEVLSKLLFTSIGREVLDIEIASLL